MKLLIAGFVAVLALPSIAAAQDGGRPRGRMRAAMLEKFDVNGDGQLQPAERKQAKQALRERRVQRFIRRFDTNRDGNVGPDEMPPGAALKLRRLDANGDGWVQPGERRRDAPPARDGMDGSR